MVNDGGQTEEERCLEGVAGEGNEKIKCGGEKKSGKSCRDFPEFTFIKELDVPPPGHAVGAAHHQAVT